MGGRSILWGLLMLGLVPAAHGRDRLHELEQRLNQLEDELARRPLDISEYHLPRRVSFCGEEVNLENPWVRERLEKELILVLGDRAQILLWMKRARQVFPVIEAQADAVGACKDLKYLAVVESSLRPAVSSHASARGWWQFMSGTAKQYGLEVDRAWDERADLADSTKAGLKYLVDLKNRFGTWSLAMAAYNTGPNRLQRAQETQGLTDFWRLDLFDEAERYVPRIISVKVVLSDPKAFGFQQGIKDGWVAPATGVVKVRLAEGREVPVVDMARGTGIDYRILRQLNPELGGDNLPTVRTVALAVPAGTEKGVKAWLDDAAQGTIRRRPASQARVEPDTQVRAEDRPPPPKASARTAAEAPAVARAEPEPELGKGARVHVVKPGDSLWSLAQDHKVSVSDLRRWNKLDNRTALRPGQRLVVRPGK